MPSDALKSVLSGAKDVLGVDDTASPVSDGGPAVRPKPSVSKPQTKVQAKPAEQPAPKPTPNDHPEPSVSLGDGAPILPAKRIGFPSGAVMELPGHWGADLVNAVSKKFHETTKDFVDELGAADSVITNALAPNPENYSSAVKTNLKEVPKTLARELYAGDKAIASAPSALLHAASDEETPEESQKFGQGFEKKIGPTGRVIDRSVVEPVLNALSDYGHGNVTVDDLLNNLPEALGQSSGATVAGKIAGDTLKGDEPSAENEAARMRGYKGAMPKNITGAARTQWMDENATPERKMDAIRHEVTHADYALKAGHPVDDMGFYAGHNEMNLGGREGFSEGAVYSDDTFWRKNLSKAKSPTARANAAGDYLKHLLAPERVEELQGYGPEEINESAASDRAQADEFLRKRLKLSPDEAETVKNQIRQELRNEITPDTMERYTHAAKQIIDNHYGGSVAPKAVSHYLNGGTFENLPDELKPETSGSEPETGIDLSKYGMQDLGEILGKE